MKALKIWKRKKNGQVPLNGHFDTPRMFYVRSIQPLTLRRLLHMTEMAIEHYFFSSPNSLILDSDHKAIFDAKKLTTNCCILNDKSIYFEQKEKHLSQNEINPTLDRLKNS